MTLKHLLKTFGVRIGRVASSFSLLVAAAVALAGPYADLSNRLGAANSSGEKLAILRGVSIDDERLAALANRALARGHGNAAAASEDIKAAEDYIQLMAIAEDAANPGDQRKLAERIKKSGLYPDQAEKEEANWLSGAARRLKNLFEREDSSSRPKFNAPAPPAFGFLIPLVWIVLVGLLLAFIVFAARFISFSRSKKRKAKAVLEEDEPERTLDEWLALADAHEREGRFREAVRALYLACLLKFDERNVARFIRSQTNWEHLARIESSPRLPAGIDFRAATKAFDSVWYGHKVRGKVDVDDFRTWYGSVTEGLQRAAA
jgi:hypothetical protein